MSLQFDENIKLNLKNKNYIHLENTLKIILYCLISIFIFIVEIKIINKNLNEKNNMTKNIIITPESLIFVSYSELLEDLILYGFLYDIKNGFYIDVGASDPYYGSVTKMFYLKGWNGINIEPLKIKYKLLIKERKRDINLNLGAGEKKERKTFYIQNYLSTIKANLSKTGSKKTVITIETMMNICKKYVPKNIEIQFCKIDVEGAERDVLLGFDFKNYRPKIFCIESTLPTTNIPTYETFENILYNNNYSFVYKYKVNRFYIDNKYIFLKERLILIEGLIKLYRSKYK